MKSMNIEEKIAWLRADCARRDVETAKANAAFDKAFWKALRE